MIFFFFNDTATTEIYTLSLHDALPIFPSYMAFEEKLAGFDIKFVAPKNAFVTPRTRSEEHTSELQSRPHLVCRLLLEKKKNIRLLMTSLSPLPSRIEVSTQRSELTPSV